MRVKLRELGSGLFVVDDTTFGPVAIFDNRWEADGWIHEVERLSKTEYARRITAAIDAEEFVGSDGYVHWNDLSCDSVHRHEGVQEV